MVVVVVVMVVVVVVVVVVDKGFRFHNECSGGGGVEIGFDSILNCKPYGDGLLSLIILYSLEVKQRILKTLRSHLRDKN